MSYRGRIAPTPTGFLHLGHARTFALAAQRCRAAAGTLILRIEDLDAARCRGEYARAAAEDLRRLGIVWDEGPDVGGPCAPYVQSENFSYFLSVWERLKNAGAIYPCRRSRRDVAAAARAPHAEDEAAEPIFPPQWRPPAGTGRDFSEPGDFNWRFRVPDGEEISWYKAEGGFLSPSAGESVPTARSIPSPGSTNPSGAGIFPNWSAALPPVWRAVRL